MLIFWPFAASQRINQHMYLHVHSVKQTSIALLELLYIRQCVHANKIVTDNDCSLLTYIDLQTV